MKKRIIWHYITIIFKLLPIKSSIMFNLISWDFIISNFHKEHSIRNINFNINHESIIKLIFRINNILSAIFTLTKFKLCLLPLLIFFKFLILQLHLVFLNLFLSHISLILIFLLLRYLLQILPLIILLTLTLNLTLHLYHNLTSIQ